MPFHCYHCNIQLLKENFCTWCGVGECEYCSTMCEHVICEYCICKKCLRECVEEHLYADLSGVVIEWSLF